MQKKQLTEQQGKPEEYSKKKANKKSEYHKYRRRMTILKELYKKDILTREEMKEIANRFDYKELNKCVREDLEYLKKEVPFVVVRDVEKGPIYWIAEPYRCFKHMGIYERIKDWENSNSLIPRTVVELLSNLNASILLVGKGSTCLEIVKELFASDLTIKKIFTGMLPIVCEAIKHDAFSKIWTPEGAISQKSAYIEESNAIEQLSNQSVNASVTSFMGVKINDKDGKIVFFGDDGEEADKKMNLQPTNCSHVVIAMEIEKFDQGGVKMATEDDLLPDKKYYVVTDVPDENKKRLEILKKLNKKDNITIMFALAEPATLEDMIDMAKKSLA